MMVGDCCQEVNSIFIWNIQHRSTEFFQQYRGCQNYYMAQYVVDRTSLLDYYNIIEH